MTTSPRSRFARSISVLCAAAVCAVTLVHAQAAPRAFAAGSPPRLDRERLARQQFGNDAPWYVANIPFLELDDPGLQRTYYYRWQVYRSHLRDLGPHGHDVTEFLPAVTWARHPYEDLNDSSSFHILEGRWLRNPAYVEALVDHLYSGAGNDRHFSESVASATLEWTKVTGDPAPALKHLDAMRETYNLWDDHFDARRGLYWIEPVLDATEFTISSIDASGAGFAELPAGKNMGFTGGFAFRPSINAYQFGNAQAIAALAAKAHLPDVAASYTARAEQLQHAMLAELWNPALGHFTDIYQRSTPTVTAGDFIRGRELVGLVPWQFHVVPILPDPDAPSYAAAWKHLLSPAELGGPFGLRTDEPSYERYMRQYVFEKGTTIPECQWNGPSWPFQTSQILSGMLNLLDDYPAATASQAGVSAATYVHLLRQFAAQHKLPSGTYDLQEDLNPDTGAVIVGLPRSHHYLHSTFNDLVVSGLIGLRPRGDDLLEIRPQLPPAGSAEPPIRFFALDGVRYHGHELSIFFDHDGSHYGRGAGLSVLCDGKMLASGAPVATGLEVRLPPAPRTLAQPLRTNLAVNVWGRAPSAYESDLPIATASSQAPEPETISAPAPMLYQPLDGREWFFPEIAHGWSPALTPADPASPDWYAVDLRKAALLDTVELSFFASTSFAAPQSVQLQTRQKGGPWQDLPLSTPTRPVANGVTTLHFTPTRIRELRVVLERSGALPERLVTLKAFARN